MSAETNIQFLAEHREALGQRLAEHLLLTGVTILGAFIIGVTLAIFAFRKPALRTPLLAIVGMLQTIPGIALLVMAMAVFQRIGTVPALAALLLYALLPIVQNTLVGLTSLSPTLSEAARGLGLSKWHRLRYVRLPLAMPMMMAGLRTSAVQTVGLATLARVRRGRWSRPVHQSWAVPVGYTAHPARCCSGGADGLDDLRDSWLAYKSGDTRHTP